MDKVGPICRSAIDCAIVFDIIRGSDKADPITKDGAFLVNWGKSANEFRVGYLEKNFNADTTESGENGRKVLEVFREM